MAETNKNIVTDSTIRTDGGNVQIGDTHIHNYDSSEDDPTIKCFNCDAPLDDPRSQRTGVGVVCYSCEQLNYDRPTLRKSVGGRYQNMETGADEKYTFYITEIQVRLAKKKKSANEEALEYAKKAIELSERTPDAYLFKALCTYFLTPKSELADDSADKILSPIGTARRLNENYEFLQIISGMIAGLYFRYINLRLSQLLEELKLERQNVLLRSQPSNMPSKAIVNKERETLKYLNQFAICYDIAPNPLFLRRELEYYLGQNSRFHTVHTPILTLNMGSLNQVQTENKYQIEQLLSLIKNNQYSLRFATEQYDKILQEKIARYQAINPNWRPPALRLYSPFGEHGLTIEEIRANLESQIQALETEEREEQAERERQIRRQREADAQRQREEEIRQRRMRNEQRLMTVGIIAAAGLGVYLVGLLIGIIYTELSEQAFLFGDFMYALLKIPFALVALAIGLVLFFVFWLLEALTGWVFGWSWNLSGSIWEWAWDDITVGWLWKETGGIYLFSGVLIWAVLLWLYKLIKS